MLLKRYIFAAPLPHFLSILLHQYRTFCHFYRTTTALFGKIAGAVPHLFAQKTAPKHGPCPGPCPLPHSISHLHGALCGAVLYFNIALRVRP